MPLGIFQGQRAQRAFRRLFLAAPVFFAFPFIFLSPQDCRQQHGFSFPWSSYYPWLSLIPPKKKSALWGFTMAWILFLQRQEGRRETPFFARARSVDLWQESALLCQASVLHTQWSRWASTCLNPRSSCQAANRVPCPRGWGPTSPNLIL